MATTGVMDAQGAVRGSRRSYKVWQAGGANRYEGAGSRSANDHTTGEIANGDEPPTVRGAVRGLRRS